MRWQSPLGPMLLAGDGEALTGLWFFGQARFAASLDPGAREGESPAFAGALRWLALYFAGKRPEFMPPLRLKGTEFQRTVWAALSEIPYGETASYGEVAARIAARRGRACSARAVGAAAARNPVSLIVPCHRLVACGGPGGYAGGLRRKQALLRLEGAADW